MNKIILGLCLLSSSSLVAQATLTNSIFPQAGDVWQVSTNFNPTVTVTAPAATATTWDFTTLTEDLYDEPEIQAASTGAVFANYPDADILQELIPAFGGDAYVDVTTSEVTTIAGGLDFFGTIFDAPFNDPQVTQIAPITYGTTHTDDFQSYFGTAIDSVPFLRQFLDGIAAQLPFQVDTDSIRFNVEGNLVSTVDAFGSCNLPNANYDDVLRQKYTQYREIGIELRFVPPVGFAFWLDVTSIITAQAPVPIPESDTLIYYDFLIEGQSQPLVRINMAPDESIVTSIEFKNSLPNSVNELFSNSNSPARFYPNPSQGSFNIDLTAVPMGNYAFEIMNIDGRSITQGSVLGGDNNWVVLNKDTPPGLYVCIIRDENGAVIAQNRITINP